MDAALAARWLWRTTGIAALARGALLPFAGLYRVASLARNAAYDAGILAAQHLPLPSIGVGNLAVGGTGKTPLTAFLAAELVRRGCRPGVVLRGYGADEPAEHAAANPGALVEAAPDRHAASARAALRGADCLVLDDCLQRRDVTLDVMVAVVAAETWGPPRWPLPAGPWREGAEALGRADIVVVTARTAGDAAAGALASGLAQRTRQGLWATARLAPVRVRALHGGPDETMTVLSGRHVLAVCGIGEPERFADQLRAAGAVVTLRAYGDHHPYTPGDVRAIIEAAGREGTVVTTAKDAVKLRTLWPPAAPSCLVAELEVRITGGADTLGSLLDRVATAARDTRTPATAAPPVRRS